MRYERICSEFPNKSYEEVERDEVKYLFDVLADNSTTNIAKETGFNINFVNSTIENYINNKLKYATEKI